MNRDRTSETRLNPAGTHILVVDNNVPRRRLTERVLKQEGFAVAAVGEGFSAIRAAGERRFNLAIVALALPGTLDGMTTLRHLRGRQPGLGGLFTGDVGQWPARLDERDDFIASPMQPHELLGCVFELLQRSRSRLNAS